MSVASSDIYTTSSMTSGYLSQKSLNAVDTLRQSPPSCSSRASSTVVKPKQRWIDMSSNPANPELRTERKSVIMTSSNPTKRLNMASCGKQRRTRTSLNVSPYQTACTASNNELVSLSPQLQTLNTAIPLSPDPRLWTKPEVQSWLKYMSLSHNLQIDSSRFDMNGKALCLMNMEMFASRVPTGGKLLFKDFKLRLHRAIFLEDLHTRQILELSTLYQMQAAALRQLFLQR